MKQLRNACKLGRLIGTTHRLTAADRALVRGWLDTGTDTRGRTVSAAAMAQGLSELGHPIGETTCKTHRARSCVCWRKD